MIAKCSFPLVSELDDTDDGSVVNVEAVLFDGAGVMRFGSRKKLKKLILADMVKSVGSDSISIV